MTEISLLQRWNQRRGTL
uniref:Uncharacterized protein n=1 Tax=Arundo donax TaxID=35708 RepID=A0A0A9A6C1_ARUDO